MMTKMMLTSRSVGSVSAVAAIFLWVFASSPARGSIQLPHPSHHLWEKRLGCGGPSGFSRGTGEVDSRKVGKDPLSDNAAVAADAGAAGDAMCCETKNNSCVAYGARLNSPTATSCFCDVECMTNGDCCLDYAEHCPAVDCVVDDEWSEWTDCDVRCGQGLKRRHRKVKVEPRNGGLPCHNNDTEQTASCTGNRCKVQRSAKKNIELGETGRIIPAAFATWRHDKLYSPFQDIRKNLFDHYGDPSAVNRPAYGARFELTDVHSTCRKMAKRSNAWLLKLVKGETLCVECQSFAMQRELGARCRGHGVLEQQTQWKAVTVPGCHGKWRLVTSHADGYSCDPKDGLSFSFV